MILFILLSGYPPFAGKSDSRILARVQQGSYSFTHKEWEHVSAGAKALIGRMLVVDMEARASAGQLLQDPWFSAAAAAPAAALGQHMVKRLKMFAGLSRLKRLALVVLARTLTDRDVNRLRVGGWGRVVHAGGRPLLWRGVPNQWGGQRYVVEDNCGVHQGMRAAGEGEGGVGGMGREERASLHVCCLALMCGQGWSGGFEQVMGGPGSHQFTRMLQMLMRCADTWWSFTNWYLFVRGAPAANPEHVSCTMQRCRQT